MASTKEYKDFILEQLSLLDGITCKPMMAFGLVHRYYMLKEKTYLTF